MDHWAALVMTTITTRLVGAVPPKFGELVQLQQLLLYHNDLTGTWESGTLRSANPQRAIFLIS